VPDSWAVDPVPVEENDEEDFRLAEYDLDKLANKG